MIIALGAAGYVVGALLAPRLRAHDHPRVEAASILIALAAQPLGPLAGGLLVDQYGARIAFLALGGVVGVGAMMLTLGLRKMP